MEVQFSPEKELRLAQLASYHGKEASQFVQETVERLLEDDARFRAAVQRGIEQADSGDLIEDDRVRAWLEERERSA